MPKEKGPPVDSQPVDTEESKGDETTVAKRLEDACLLTQTADSDDTVAVCALAAKYEIGSVVCSLSDVATCAEFLSETEVEVCGVVSFPYGFDNIAAKIAGVANAIKEGAHSVDFVVNIGALMDNNVGYLQEEFFQLGQLPIKTKAIIEISLLSPSHIKLVCELLEKSPVEYIKTCTGKLSEDLKITLEEKIKRISLIKKWAPTKKIKLSGGVSDLSQARRVLAAGADLIGTSSTFKIAQEELEEKEKEGEDG